LKALKKVGYNPKVYEKEFALSGYQGDARSQKAHIVIPRSQIGSASNDIGFFRETDGTYTVHVSAFDKNKWNKKFPEIVKHYATDVVNNIVQSGPYHWDGTSTTDNGVTTIRISVRE